MSVRNATLIHPPRNPLPPTLPSNHLLGHLPAMRADPAGLFDRAHLEMGDVVQIRLAHLQIVSLARPEHWYRVLVEERERYVKKTRGYEMMRLILGNGLVTSEGEFWRRQRRIAQPAFRRKVIAGFARTMAVAAQDTADRWDAAARRGEPLDIAAEMMRLTLRIAGETLFSMDLTGDAEEIGDAVTTVLEAFSPLTMSPVPAPHLWPTPTAHRFRKGLKILNRVVMDIIAQRRASGEVVPDLLGMFMASEDVETGERMTDEQLRDEVMTMILAGHETTANALAWTFYALSTHPEVLRKVELELDTVLGDGQPDMSVMGSLPYLNQVLQESMRMYPPVWMLSRMASDDDEIGDYRIRKGTYVYMPLSRLHKHADIWTNPEAFDPDRFSPERIAARKALGVHKFAYLPFSGGQRKCIGDHFAKMEALILLAVLLKKHRLSMVSGHPVVPEASITMRPKYGLMMNIHRR